MGENMIREPAVAGAFYESNVKYLRESIEDCFKHRLGPKELPKLSRINKEKQVNAIMVPHAGYVYSGPTAAHAYSKLVKDGYPETFVILCPNHTGYGADVSVYNEGSWVVPNGVCDVDNELLDPSVECECNCHKDGISGFFWNIKMFFSKIFGTNKMCECGVAHY